MRVRCPNCSHPIEVVNDLQFDKISCPSCGSQMNLSGSDEDTITAMVTARIPALQCFQLLNPIGAGQFGRVWRARDTELERIVAVKLPHNQYLSSEEAGFFVREARAAAQLNHPNIVTVYEVGRHEDTVYIVSEYIDGLSLREWSQHYRPDARRAAETVIKIARALEHAHDKGVIHRDMKPGNILMDAAGEPHITDFGLAKREGSDVTIAATGQVLGTPAYMAPEQVRDGHSADRRSDLYSVGVILYELLTGDRPFRGGKRLLLHQVLHDDPRPPRSINRKVPKDLETICLKAMAKSPDERYPTATALADDLERFLAGKPVQARRISPPVRLYRWAKRRPALAATILLSLLVLVLLPLALLGPRTAESRTARAVRLATDPPGADVVLIPLDRVTGVPQRDQAIQAGASPIDVKCEPGDYLVIAWQNNSLFHEVYRHVPASYEQLPGVYPHLDWRQDDETISLPTIKLFTNQDVTANMAHVDPGTCVMATTDLAKDTSVDVAEFFVDVTEVTVGQVKSLGMNLPLGMSDPTAADDLPLHNVTWHDAVTYAEVMGKRLLSDEEFQYLVTLGGSRSDDQGGWEVSDAPVPGLVTSAAFDRLEWERVSEPLIGLRSNVLEWTSNWWVGTGTGVNSRVVRGGYSLSGDMSDPGIVLSKPPPRMLNYPPLAYPRLGFRCARSAHPPWRDK